MFGMLFALVNSCPPISYIVSAVVALIGIIAIYLLRQKIMITLGIILVIFLLFKLFSRRRRRRHDYDSGYNVDGAREQHVHVHLEKPHYFQDK